VVHLLMRDVLMMQLHHRQQPAGSVENWHPNAASLCSGSYTHSHCRLLEQSKNPLSWMLLQAVTTRCLQVCGVVPMCWQRFRRPQHHKLQLILGCWGPALHDR
jgi:hypothetical protein